MILGNFTEKKSTIFFPNFSDTFLRLRYYVTFLFYTFEKLFCSEPFIILDSKVDVIDDEYIKLTFSTFQPVFMYYFQSFRIVWVNVILLFCIFLLLICIFLLLIWSFLVASNSQWRHRDLDNFWLQLKKKILAEQGLEPSIIESIARRATIWASRTVDVDVRSNVVVILPAIFKRIFLRVPMVDSRIKMQ